MKTLFCFSIYNCKSHLLKVIYNLLLESIQIHNKNNTNKHHYLQQKQLEVKISLSRGYPRLYYGSKK